MGATFAKLDNQDKIISLERKLPNGVKQETDIDFNRLMEFINKYGYIRIELDAKQFNNYLNLLGSKYLKKNPEVVKTIYGDMGLSYVKMTMMLSLLNLVVLQEKTKEGFDNIIGHEFNNYSVYESFLNTDASPKDPVQIVSSVAKAVVDSAAKEQVNVDSSVTRAVVDSAAKEQVNVDSSVTRAVVDSAAKEQVNVDGPRIGIAVEPDRTAQFEKEGNFYILLPKIYFTNERNSFIDFLIASLPMGDRNSNQAKLIYNMVKNILKKLNETPNPEIKIANTIGLFVRVAIGVGLQNLLSREAKYSEEEKLQILSEIIGEHLEDIPYDECVFYNDKLNFIKFSPNICSVVKEEKELKLRKLYETKCPVQEEKACPVQEQIKCPECGEQKCPEHICPTCVKEECSKPEEPSNIWKYTSVLLTIIVIILVFVMIFKSTGTKPNVKNLSKLN